MNKSAKGYLGLDSFIIELLSLASTNVYPERTLAAFSNYMSIDEILTSINNSLKKNRSTEKVGQKWSLN